MQRSFQFNDSRRDGLILLLNLALMLLANIRALDDNSIVLRIHFPHRDPRWRLVSADGSFALFVLDSVAETAPLALDSPPEITRILTTLTEKWRKSPEILKESFYHLSTLLSHLGLSEQAGRVRKAFASL